jgi:succinylglutamate desuccinylase
VGAIVNLNILTEFPKELLNVDVREVHEVLGGPTLFHLKGKRKDALFLSTLLHANETTSFMMLQKLIKKYAGQELPRDLIIFVGNTYAAEEGMRHLPGQADFNRIWENGEAAENQLALDVIKYAESSNLFASIDVHNNTGKNPHYGCVNVMAPQFLNLASHFGEHTVFFTEPHNVQSMAFSKFCTSITIECGLPGEPKGVEASLNFVDKIFNLDELTPNPDRQIPEVFHTMARLKVNPEARVDFDDNADSEADLSFVSNLDSRNFDIVHKNSHMGFAKDLKLIWVENNDGKDITDQFLKIENGELITTRVFIPSMFTKDIYVMKEDCLGYVMEHMIPASKLA